MLYKLALLSCVSISLMSYAFEVDIWQGHKEQPEYKPKWKFGAQSMVAPLKKVLVRRPTNDFGVEDYKKWHYTGKPDVAKAQKEHDDFVEILKKENVEVFYHMERCPELADSIFVHDPALVTDQGAIILRMGKELRRGEEAAIEKTFNLLGIPTYHKYQDKSLIAEAGDMLWLDEKTLAIGHGFRTNDLGIKFLEFHMKPLGVNIISIDLPYDQGKDACLHLQSLISLVDHKIAVVYKKLLAVHFIQYLERRGFTLINVPEDEYARMATNILTIRPKVCVTLEGNNKTKEMLEAVGCTVYTYKGDEISLKAEGGPTCLTRPLLRD